MVTRVQWLFDWRRLDNIERDSYIMLDEYWARFVIRHQRWGVIGIYMSRTLTLTCPRLSIVFSSYRAAGGLTVTLLSVCWWTSHLRYFIITKKKLVTRGRCTNHFLNCQHFLKNCLPKCVLRHSPISHYCGCNMEQ